MQRLASHWTFDQNCESSSWSIDPEHHVRRREVIAQTLETQYGDTSTTVHTDAADYVRFHQNCDHTPTLITSFIVTQSNTLQANEAATPLAIPQTKSETIIIDSQAACRAYQSGRIPKTAMHIPSQNSAPRNVSKVHRVSYVIPKLT